MVLGLTGPCGLFRFKGGRFEQVEGGPGGTIQALHRDHAGRLWIASAEGGLGRIDNPAAGHVAMRVYQRSNGLASNEVWCLAEDRAGRVYAGSVRGVDPIDPATPRLPHSPPPARPTPPAPRSAFP